MFWESYNNQFFKIMTINQSLLPTFLLGHIKYSGGDAVHKRRSARTTGNHIGIGKFEYNLLLSKVLLYDMFDPLMPYAFRSTAAKFLFSELLCRNNKKVCNLIHDIWYVKSLNFFAFTTSYYLKEVCKNHVTLGEGVLSFQYWLRSITWRLNTGCCNIFS